MTNKIISMSVWGTDPRYIVGAKRQVELAKKYYPDWKVRIYTDNPENYPELKNKVDFYKIEDESYGMFWRFLPMFEDKDNIVMVRDSDSRITEREVRAIDEWIESEKSFHTFKDHEAHYEFPIIGCAFAYKGKFDENLLEVMKIYMNMNKFYLSDQYFLRDYIYPLVKNDMLLHSMNEDGWFGTSRKLLRNKFSFCGNGYDEYDMPIYPDSLGGSIENAQKFDGGFINE
jgi:hypothetical protein